MGQGQDTKKLTRTHTGWSGEACYWLTLLFTNTERGSGAQDSYLEVRHRGCCGAAIRQIGGVADGGAPLALLGPLLLQVATAAGGGCWWWWVRQEALLSPSRGE